MMNNHQTAEFLQSVRFFQDLDDGQRHALAQKFKPISLLDGEELFREGNPGGDFYIITSGMIHLARWEDDNQTSIGTLGTGEFLGHEAYVRDSNHTETAVSVGQSTLLTLDIDQFDWMLEQHPEIEDDIKFLARSYQIGRQQAFKWLGADEIIHFIAKKHIYKLFYALVVPILMAVFGAAALIASIPNIAAFNYKVLAFIGTFSTVVGVLWTLWKWIDWGNDFYIVTNQRVIWLEKIILMYESRNETPLDAILSVNINTSYWQRLFRSGDVVVNTFTSKIIMRGVDHPEQLNKTIQDYWQRSQNHAEIEEQDARIRILRDRLGFDEKVESTGIPALPPEKEELSLFERLINRLSVRFEMDGTVTYRKHWYLLLRRIWIIPALMTPVGILIIGRLITFGSGTSFFGLAAPMDDLGYMIIALAAIIVASSPWWIYHIADWSNDVYQVDHKSIFDIDRKPLGKDISKSAPLEKILNMNVEQTFLQRILNFGTVLINIGEATFSFEGVHNPSMVQGEIFSRYYARKETLKREAAEGERKRMVNWISTYHDQIDGQKEVGDEPEFY
ncbi:MAG: cyclic nucleotide-binding domain-containing protein [Chloroflexota bacterium]